MTKAPLIGLTVMQVRSASDAKPSRWLVKLTGRGSDFVTIGRGDTREKAVERAVAELEAAVEYLQGPGDFVTDINGIAFPVRHTVEPAVGPAQKQWPVSDLGGGAGSNYDPGSDSYIIDGGTRITRSEMMARGAGQK